MKRLTTILMAALLSFAAVVAGCGGGVGTGGTGSFAQGTISGFGSIIVNGVHYDDSAAAVSDDDGAGRSRDDLRLGMSVQIEAGDVVNGAATAQSIRYASEISGPVATVDAANARFTLLGQTVAVDALTVFDDRLAGGLAALAAGQRVEVYATWDATALRYRATRVEPSSANGNFRLRGVASELSATNRTVKIGSGRFTWTGNTPAGLADGAFVKVQVQSAPAGTALWTLLGAASGEVRPPEGRDVRVKGPVTAFTSTASFVVNGLTVNATGASVSGGTLALGVRVEVRGRMAAGVLQASEVRVEAGEAPGDDFQLEGGLSNLDTAAATFKLRNVTVAWSAQTQFSGGTAAQLANGRKVKVKGVLSADGTRVEARSIELEG